MFMFIKIKAINVIVFGPIFVIAINVLCYETDVHGAAALFCVFK